MAKKCKICRETVHPVREKLGYDTCVVHSTAERYSGIISATGKTDYALNVVRDPELAKHLKQLSPVYE